MTKEIPNLMDIELSNMFEVLNTLEIADDSDSVLIESSGKLVESNGKKQDEKRNKKKF